MAKKDAWRRSMVETVMEDIELAVDGMTIHQITAGISGEQEVEGTPMVDAVKQVCNDLVTSGKLWFDKATGKYHLHPPVKVKVAIWKKPDKEKRRSIDDAWEPPVNAADFTMPYGKFFGKSLREIWQVNKGYVHWLSWQKNVGLYRGKTVAAWAQEFLRDAVSEVRQVGRSVAPGAAGLRPET